MRINGFSGMDIDSMVKSLMTAQRAPLDKLNQQKEVLQWTRDSYREMNSKFFDFRNNKLMKYGQSSAMNGFNAAVSGNTDAVKAEATPSANKVPMNISVKSLATQASLGTQGVGYGITTKTTLADIQKKVDDTQSPDAYELHINGVDFKFDKSLTISDVINKISSDTKANATASFDEITGKLTILSKEYGDKQTITLSDDSTNPSTLLSLFGGGKPAVPGENASVVINNEPLSFESNTFTINGVQLTLLSTTTSDPVSMADDKPATIKIQPDATKTLETIKSFINDYNDLINTLNTKVGEEKYRDFPPLSDDQKKEMTDNDIKLWEDKAKSGLLKNDSILSSAISSMRMTISENMGKLSDLGITTGQYYEGGKLYLDESKLKQAIEKDPQGIMDLFQGPVSASSDGIFDKMSDIMNDAMGSLSDKAGTTKYSGDLNSVYKEESVMGKQLKDYNKRILDLQNRLSDMEDRYYKQFSAMETAMNQYNSQSASLTSYLGGS